MDRGDADWLSHAVGDLLGESEGLDPGGREGYQPQVTLALVRAQLRRGQVFTSAATSLASLLQRDGSEARARAAAMADEFGICGTRRRGLLAEVLCTEASAVLRGRSHRAIVLGVWSVPEPSSPKGRYVTEDGSGLRALGVVCLHRDVEGVCRVCGDPLPARRRLHDGPVKAHTQRVRYHKKCEPLLGSRAAGRFRDAFHFVFADLEAAIRPPPRKAQIVERPDLSKADFGPHKDERSQTTPWPPEKREAWLAERINVGL